MSENTPYECKLCSKLEWPDGPWQCEADTKTWDDPTTGYACAILRHDHFGHLCGYVKLPLGHPLFGKSYNFRAPFPKEWRKRPLKLDQDIGPIPLFCASINSSEDLSEAPLDLIFHCHGGLTYGAHGWLGFDCAHVGDLSPGMSYQFDPVLKNVYRDMLYVTLQCERLAQQLSDYAKLTRPAP